MQNYGKIFKKIRESKCLTQSYVAGEDLSRSLYAKIEKGDVTPSFLKFNCILKKLNLTYDEFFFYNSGGLKGRNLILELFKNVMYFSDITFVKKVEDLCKTYLLEHDDDTVENIVLICQSIVFLRNGEVDKAQALVNPIWEQLSKQDSLYYLEMQLLNHILFIFDIDTARAMVDRCLKALETCDFQEGVVKLRVSLLVNYSHLLISKGLMIEAFSKLKEAKLICEKEKRVDLMIYIYYYVSIIFYKSGNKKYYYFYIRQAVTLVEYTADEATVELMLNTLSNYISEEDIIKTREMKFEINQELAFFNF
ncbi:helix-turn-helix domain-containing protein [Listeria booriae]|uniref:Helix-turn-helix transcriptional regulator n=1 Tax=Listeria booriae TaxID=1552123 RepID=A0A7X0XI81_9LIST|nr:helix-turn-helix transcriptional regulator [Listeria booriae]MBC1561483.1 helix-turn-helix transcriptional regulator [Listeria booriae]MBC1574087.1 helix-turn-helix transcriptional regulator [Listeria booriae]MBC2103568.1 helix-turn-helix transcriptional regulator [Listeria booriae]MBC2321812.1 helix-turn-helix transcriptional regulator [Listeria booriae]MCD2205697.1 helix-turn-helix domain-containing protein [Listeria booriae]